MPSAKGAHRARFVALAVRPRSECLALAPNEHALNAVPDATWHSLGRRERLDGLSAFVADESLERIGKPASPGGGVR